MSAFCSAAAWPSWSTTPADETWCESIVGYLRHLGYSRIEFNFEAPDHPHGPAFALYAER